MRLKKITGLIASVTLVLALGACGGSPRQAPGETGSDVATSSESAAGGTLTIASVIDNNSYDPTQLNIGHQMQYWDAVYDTLLDRDENFELVPGLATEWSYNEDNTILNLKLRDDVTFTDGSPFNAEAVKANIANLAAGTGQNSYMAKQVAEVEIVGDYEVNIKLSGPDPSYLEYLSSVGGVMTSPASHTAADVATNPVGTGPYVLDDDATVVGSTYTYTRNPDYWDAESFPYDTVVIKPMNDLTARLNAIRSGQVNGASADANTAAEAEGAGLTLNTSSVDWVGLFIADREGQMVPALGDVRVRQAINMAFDKESMLENLSAGRGAITTQIFNPVTDAYDPSLDDDYSFDVAAAQALMAEAGYADGFEVEMPELAGFQAFNPAIASQLAEIGVRVKWVPVAANATITEILSGKFPMFFFSLGSQSAWQDVQKSLLPTSAWNTAKAEDPELAQLLDTAKNATDDERADAMNAVTTWVVENAWFAPFYRVDAVYLTDEDTAVDMQPYVVVPPISNFKPAE